MKAVAAIVALLAIAVLAAIGGNVPPVDAQQSLPAPTNVAVADGPNPGEVVIAWTKVPAAKFYRIGWIAEEDYLAIDAAKGDVLEAFAFIDVSNRGQNVHTLTRLTPGVNYVFLLASNTARYGEPKLSAPVTLTVKDYPQSDIGSASVEITWSAVSGAEYYRIGWIARQDYIAISEAGGDVLEAFAFIDVSNKGQTSHTVTRLTPGVEYVFLVGSNSSRHGTPQWGAAPQTLTPGAGQPGTGQPGGGPTQPAPACPAPNHPVFSNPEPRPVPSVRGDYDADDDGLIEVANLQQLDAIRYDLEGKGDPSNLLIYYAAFPNAVAGMGCPDGVCSGYELVADLDFDTNGNGRADAADEYWDDGAGWLPIGDHENAFLSTFDGGGHTISNLFINRAESTGIGLFGYSGGPIRRVGLLSVNVSGYSAVGGLVGSNGRYKQGLWSDGGGRNISDIYVTGAVTGGGGSVGGLAGYNYSRATVNISGSCTSVAVTGAGRNVGGLVGYNNPDYWEANISGSYATGTVTGSSGNVGGLVGHNRADEYGSSAEISGSYATGDVAGTGENVGGLVGYNYSHSYGSAEISGSYAAGDVTGGSDNVGGLVGSSGSDISVSYATGDVTGGSDNVGGLVGSSGSDISGSYSTGAVKGVGGNVGGLVGQNRSSGWYDSTNISVSYATGTVTGGSDNVGGLVGSNGGSIWAAYATAAVTGGSDNVGGLVGSNGGSIWAAYATGDASGGADDVSSSNNMGGLVGHNTGGIWASYATGDASGFFKVAGLVGFNEGESATVTASYSIGQATGGGAVGGLVGNNTGSVTNSYWDTTTSEQQHSDGGQGKTTAELQAPTFYTGIYSNWNVDLDNADRDRDITTGGDDPWAFGTSSHYPTLKYGGLNVAAQGGAYGPPPRARGPAPRPQPGSEREALELFYQDTNGANWLNQTNWRSNLPLNQWYGVDTDASGNVVSVDLRSNNLDGFITPELRSLNHLGLLRLEGNSLRGCIPAGLTVPLDAAARMQMQEGGILDQVLALIGEQVGDEVGNLGPGDAGARFIKHWIVPTYGLGLSPCPPPLPPLTTPLAQQTAQTDREALLSICSIYSEVDKGYCPWPEWQTDKPLQDWHGVHTEYAGTNTDCQDLSPNCRVTRLELTGKGLTGRIPARLSDLGELKYLNLSGNNLNGPIPQQLGHLSNLYTLALNNNDLSGSIPAHLGHLPGGVLDDWSLAQLAGEKFSRRLLDIHLQENNLTGDIPLALGNIGYLRTLEIDSEIGGCLPPNLVLDFGRGTVTTVVGWIPGKVASVLKIADRIIDGGIGGWMKALFGEQFTKWAVGEALGKITEKITEAIIDPSVQLAGLGELEVEYCSGS